MNLSTPRHQTAFRGAVQRIKLAVREAGERCVDSLGIAALSTTKTKDRDDFLAAQFELNRKLSSFVIAFDDAMDARVAREASPTAPAQRPAETRWDALTLVDDSEVEAQMDADRLGVAILHTCEWELRELDTYMGSLMQHARPEKERNPLRPEVIGKSIFTAVESVSERPELRKVLAAEIARALAITMPAVYREIVADLRSAGVQPLGMAVRTTEGPGTEMGRHSTGFGGVEKPADALAAEDSAALGLGSEEVPSTRRGHLSSGRGSGHGPLGPAAGPASGAGGLRGPGAQAQRGGGTPIGQVDAQLMDLIRRLAFLGNAVGGDTGLETGGLASRPMSGSGGLGGIALPNLIQKHRDELRQASTGALDHMVIDIVGSLFEQILSDPKVPPQMARQLARLQLPVLRVALGDVTFFSSRRHPVRRFVNRMASLAASFDDLSDGPGKHFLGLVKDLVQEIVGGDFDQMEVYERELVRLENYIAEQNAAEVQENAGDAAAMLERRESELLQQQRYMQQLRAALKPVSMQDFLREFLCQVWSQALVQAARRDDNGALVQRLRHAARELVMSVQPKATPTERKTFLMGLPQLMKTLNEGLAMIGWPEAGRKDFFAQLLPAHAEALKAQQQMRQLDYNLLAKQIDAILLAPLPKPERVSAPLPVLVDVVDERSFSEEEARNIGLVAEGTVDWDGTVDIDLTAEPELTEVDINLEGLPPAEPAEPMRGPSLADHVELGFAYQMHLEGTWQKVKLSYVSPGRTFFIFTRGKKVQKTISMTARMLARMCESGRMRAFENAYLIERATARARAQLAALRPAAASRH
jgi:hypothetical protein